MYMPYHYGTRIFYMNKILYSNANYPIYISLKTYNIKNLLHLFKAKSNVAIHIS